MLVSLGALASIDLSHVFLTLADIRLSGSGGGEWKLSGTFRNNVAIREGELKGLPIAHPIFISPELMLLGPTKAFDLKSSESFRMKADLWQLGVLIMQLIRGSLPLPPATVQSAPLPSPSSSPSPSPSSSPSHATDSNSSSTADVNVWSESSLEEVWNLYFQPPQHQQPSVPPTFSSNTSETHTRSKHPLCYLCQSPSSSSSSPSSSSISQDEPHANSLSISNTLTFQQPLPPSYSQPGVAKLCLACWMDTSNLILQPNTNQDNHVVTPNSDKYHFLLQPTLMTSVSSSSPHSNRDPFPLHSSWSDLISLLRLLLSHNPLMRPSSMELLGHRCFRDMATFTNGVVTSTSSSSSPSPSASSHASSHASANGSHIRRVWRKRTDGNLAVQTALRPTHIEKTDDAYSPSSSFVDAGIDGRDVSSSNDTDQSVKPSSRCSICNTVYPTSTSSTTSSSSFSHHPSLPGACSCLHGWRACELWQLWSAYLYTPEVGKSIWDWVESGCQSLDGSFTLSPSLTAMNVSARQRHGIEMAPTMTIGEETVRKLGFVQPNRDENGDNKEAKQENNTHANAQNESILTASSSSSSSSVSSLTSFSTSTFVPISPRMFHIPLLPLYHLIKSTLAFRRNQRVERVWKELEDEDNKEKEKEKDRSKSNKYHKDTKDAKSKPPKRSTSLSAPSPPPHSLAFPTPLHAMFFTLVELREYLSLYPATRCDVIRVCRQAVKQKWGHNKKETNKQQHHNQHQQLSALTSVTSPAGLLSASSSSSIYPSTYSTSVSSPSLSSFPPVSPFLFLRTAVWTVLLNVSPSIEFRWKLLIDCSTRSPFSHSEIEQVRKDVARLPLQSRIDALRLEQLIGALLIGTDLTQTIPYTTPTPTNTNIYHRNSTNGNAASPTLTMGSKRIYWQGFHSIVFAIWSMVPNENETYKAFGILDKFMDIPFIRRLHVKNNSDELTRQQQHISRLLNEFDPIVSKRLEEFDLSLNLFLIPPLLTCWTHTIAIESVATLFDLLILAYGEDEESAILSSASTAAATSTSSSYHIWLLIAVSSILMRRHVILTPSATFQSVLYDFTHHLHSIDCDEWVNTILQLKANTLTHPIWDEIQCHPAI